ncbi:putative transcriptional regulatory protein, ArsR family (modular protein) [Ralstonia solanacearum PSI07]|nr:putative transcriptional regulatory protein, ArsR family (modular protein) [Ralstonia solanacearum PSI07]
MLGKAGADTVAGKPACGLDSQLTQKLNEGMPLDNDPLSTIFAALADPTRRAILARLSAGEAPVSELARPFDISAPAISKHLRVLAEAGLIEREINARWRICHLRADALRDAHGWLEAYRRHWEGNLDRLVAFVEHTQAATPARGKRAATKDKGTPP